MHAVPILESWGPWPWVAPLWILIWVAIIFTVIRLLSRRTRMWCAPGRASYRGPDEILAERFARGEIDAVEYRARRDTLRQ